MASAVLNTSGKLRRFLVLPPNDDAFSGPISKANWRFLFEAAGLNLDNFTQTPAKSVPPAAFDERAEWNATAASTSGGKTIHVVGASYRGQPVYFQVTGD
jgi:hypothetical protein